jgi:type II secretory pathway pseudopilin PulG
MKSFSQPCLALPESPKLRAKQGHATSAKHDRFSALSFLKFRIPHFAFPNKIPPSRPFRPWRESSVLQPTTTNLPLREQSAFSLTEVVIAMGVAAVAFTSIIALFPLGLNMSRESYEATQAALIAQTILADFEDQQVGAKNLRSPNGKVNNIRLIQTNQNSDPRINGNHAEMLVATSNSQTAYIAYKPYDGANNDTDTNNPLMLKPYLGAYTTGADANPNWYKNGTNGAFALVKVTISPTLRIGNETVTDDALRLDVSIETPGTANLSNRTCYQFTGAFRK